MESKSIATPWIIVFSILTPLCSPRSSLFGFDCILYSSKRQMPPFAATAPSITAQQEQLERETLSQCEHQCIHDEVYGLDCEVQRQGPYSTMEQMELTKQCSIQLEQMLLTIPIQDKQEYMEAMIQCPELVRTESPAVVFLGSVDYNIEKAATRRVSYWRTRRLVFGPDLAYLPMRLDGAMIHDIDLLSTLPCTLLACEHDKPGRPIIYLDRIRTFTPNCSHEAHLRCTFYMVQVASMEQKDAWRYDYGIVLLANYQGFDLYQHYDRRLTKTMTMMVSCMPLKIKGAHLCIGPGRSVLSIVLPMLKLMWGPEIRLRFFDHSGSPSEVTAKLETFGFLPSHLDLLFKGREEIMKQAHTFVESRRTIEQHSSE